MSQLGTCGKGCSEEKLELVRAVDFEGLTELASDAHVRAEACRAVAERARVGPARPGRLGGHLPLGAKRCTRHPASLSRGRRAQRSLG